jgi:hypothetical protein
VPGRSGGFTGNNTLTTIATLVACVYRRAQNTIRTNEADAGTVVPEYSAIVVQINQQDNPHTSLYVGFDTLIQTNDIIAQTAGFPCELTGNTVVVERVRVYHPTGVQVDCRIGTQQ